MEETKTCQSEEICQLEGATNASWYQDTEEVVEGKETVTEEEQVVMRKEMMTVTEKVLLEYTEKVETRLLANKETPERTNNGNVEQVSENEDRATNNFNHISNTEKEVTNGEEVEFKMALTKLKTHTIHCPNCYHNIEKVVLRKRPIEPSFSILVGVFLWVYTYATIIKNILLKRTRSFITKTYERVVTLKVVVSIKRRIIDVVVTPSGWRGRIKNVVTSVRNGLNRRRFLIWVISVLFLIFFLVYKIPYEVVVDSSTNAITHPSLKVVVHSNSDAVDHLNLNAVVGVSPNVVVDPTPNAVVDPTPNAIIHPSHNVVVHPNTDEVDHPNLIAVVDPTPNAVVNPNLNAVADPTPNAVVNPTPNPSELGNMKYIIKHKRREHMDRRKDVGESIISKLFSIPGIGVLLGLIFSVYNVIIRISSAYAFYNQYSERVNDYIQYIRALVTPPVGENEGIPRKQIKYMIARVLNGSKTTWSIFKRAYRSVFAGVIGQQKDKGVVKNVVTLPTDDHGVVSSKLTADSVIDKGVVKNDVTLPTDDHGIVSPKLTADSVMNNEDEEGSLSSEIFKSIVYGGLMEIIASLCIVAFFANFDATTMNMAAFALAGFIGGLFYFEISIWELRNSCHNVNWSEEMKKEVSKKYREILGRVKYFPLHAVLATLSFLIFGMIPPATYVVSFVETNDKKFTIGAVAVVSLLCISLLAISKAYVIKRKGIFEYVKTVVYYDITTAGLSFCSYLVSYLFKGWMEELKMFDKNSCAAMSHL